MRLLEKKDGKYYLGSKVLELSQYYILHQDLVEVARKIMKKLSLSTQETVILSILSENQVFCIHRIDSTNPIKVSSKRGSVQPLYTGASAKTILAFLPQGKIEKYLEETKLVPFTSNTITDKKILLEELKKIRNQGFAISKGEITENVVEIAVPILNIKNHIVGSLGIAGPKFRMKDKMQLILDNLLKETHKIAFKS